MRNVKQLICSAALAVVMGTAGSGARLHAAEFGANTPYYEDDGWLDVTEWFDGNDYNPTDEAWWRWDDETYQARKDTAGDQDSDGWYGYTTRDDDDWYYDYYDPSPYTYYDYDNKGLYDYGSRYYDYDNDGVYDAYVSYADWDGDGLYEDYDYYSFTDRGTEAQRKAARSQISRESRPQAVSGTIQKMKKVKVRGGQEHVVVSIQQGADQKDQVVIADLGRGDQFKNVNPKLGDRISVKGTKARVGKQDVVLATSFEVNGQTVQVDRNLRQITGKVLSTHKTKAIRGQQHLIAMVETTQKDKQHKIAVDLGPADRLNMKLDKGSTLTFSGFPVKVKDKPLIVAQTVHKDDKTVQVNRRPNRPAAK